MIVLLVEFSNHLAIICLQIGAGTNFIYWHGPRAQLVVTDPRMVKEILNSREETYSRGGFQKYNNKLLGDGHIQRKFFKRNDDIESDKLQQGIRGTIINMGKKRERELMAAKLEGYGNDFLGSLVKYCNDPDKIRLRNLLLEFFCEALTGWHMKLLELFCEALLVRIALIGKEKQEKRFINYLVNKIQADGIAKLKILSLITNESLRPERFAEGAAKATDNTISAFFPFGLGPTTCAGLNFAITEEKIALSMILQHDRFSLSPT
ncbi:unnamed protein product [Dovyalis caffra]|uniref:Cytochrome P450 n=1 Tax=Dovyalis caffra TaxID=77055 RepID=A0AAV1R1Z7_9ROSI|nr:unnamed protein product [Dovyalis caffra]